MSDTNTSGQKNIDVYNGTGHTEDYGTLRMCRTTSCPVDFTSSATCRQCGERTVNDAYRVSR